MGTQVQYTGGNSNFSTGSNLYTGCTNTAQGWVQNITVSPHVPPNSIYVMAGGPAFMAPQTAQKVIDVLDPPDPGDVEHMVDVLLDLRRKLDAA